MISVSIITPTFASFEVVESCHRMIGRQTFEDWEHIIVDDGSGPHVARRLMSLAATDSRIVPIVSSYNRGAGPARNLGIERAKGRYVAFLDVDDEWDKEKLAVQYNFMTSEKVPLTYGAYRIETANGQAQNEQTVLIPPPRIGYGQLLWSCPVGCLTVMAERQILDRYRFADFRRGQDWALWLRMTADGLQFSRYPGIHATYRRRAGSLSSNKLAKVRDAWSVYRHQEGLSFFKAQRLLARHAYAVMTRPYERPARE